MNDEQKMTSGRENGVPDGCRLGYWSMLLFVFIHFLFTFFHSKTIFTPSYNYDYNREDMKVEKGGREMEKGPKRRDSRLGPGMLFSFFFLLFSLKLNLKAIFFKKNCDYDYDR